MNYGIIQNRRHDKKGAGGGASSLLQDTRLREMAKQMGLDAKDLGHESAQSLWQLLDDMAANDPGAYQKFIQEQLKDGPPMASPSSSSSQEEADAVGSNTNNQTTHDATKHKKTNNNNKKPMVLLPRYFAPYPGFVVKCAMHHTVKCQQQETKLFLNCCAHEMVDMPKNPNSGKDVPKDTRAVPSTSNLEIPLAVGKLREVADVAGDVCVACDVVFHPWVMKRCEWDANFKREVMKLAIQWVQQDAQVRLVSQVGKFIKSRYKGGNVAANGNDVVTAKFLVDPSANNSNGNGSDNQSEATSEQEGGGKNGTSSVIESPSELLKQIHLNRNDSATSESLEREFLIKPANETPKNASSSAAIDMLPKPLTASSSQAKKPKSESNKSKLIQELDPSPPSSPAKPHDTATKRQQQPAKTRGTSVVKKGFLLSSAGKKKAPLYPTGSSEGHVPSPYVNLLSRSKVVDLSDVERQKKQQEEETCKLKDEFSFLSTPSREAMPTSASGSTAEVDCGDFEFEQLCMDADPELNPLQQHAEESGSNPSSDPASQLFGEGFKEISKFLAM